MTARIFGIAGSTNSAEDFRLSAGGIFVPASAINDRTGVTSVPALVSTGNFTATVSPFSCLIDGTSNSLQGSYWVTLDIATTITIGAANPSNPRIDLISMQILDNAYDGSGQQKAQLIVTAGTPAGSPVAPAAPANSISLWTVSVPAAATSVNFASAIAVFPYTAAVGGIVPVRASTDQPTVVDGVQYRHRLDVTATAGASSPLESSTDGITWRPVFDASAVPASTTAAIGTATGGLYGTFVALTLGTNWSTFINAPQYRSRPGGIEFRGALQCTATINSATQIFSGSFSTSSQRYLPWTLLNSTTNGYIQVNTNGTATLNIAVASSIPNGSIITLDGMSIVP